MCLLSKIIPRLKTPSQISNTDSEIGIKTAQIADTLWHQAVEAEDHAERLESVYRVGNLYSLVESVVSGALAALAGQTMGEEALYVTVMASEDLCSSLLW